MGIHKRQMHRSCCLLDLFRHHEHSYRFGVGRNTILDPWELADAHTTESRHPDLLLRPHIVSRPCLS